jgi:hypothetical protein
VRPGNRPGGKAVVALSSVDRGDVLRPDVLDSFLADGRLEMCPVPLPVEVNGAL